MTHSRRGSGSRSTAAAAAAGSAPDAAAAAPSAGVTLGLGSWLGPPPTAAALSIRRGSASASAASSLFSTPKEHRSPETPGTQTAQSLASLLPHPQPHLQPHSQRGYHLTEFGDDLESNGASAAGSSSSTRGCPSALSWALLLNLALLSLLALMGQQLMEARAQARWVLHAQTPAAEPTMAAAAVVVDAPCIPAEASAAAAAAPAVAATAAPVAAPAPATPIAAPEPAASAAAVDEMEDEEAGPSADQLADAALPLPPSAPGSSSSSPHLHPLCTLYRFPRPPRGSFNSSLFVTSTPNKGAGVGHQFGEWLFGPHEALKAGATYLHSPFARNSARWTGFLGFGEGEDSVLDWVAAFDPDAAVTNDVGVWSTMDSPQNPGSKESALLRSVTELAGVEVFLRAQLDPTKPLGLPPPDYLARVYAAHRDHVAADQHRAAVQGFTHAPNALQSSLAPGVPRPLLVKFDLVHILKPEIICEPAGLVQALRRKYCRARVASLLAPPESPGSVGSVDHYAAQRASHNFLIVAMHLRCGDSCFDAYRTTTFTSLAHSAQRIHALLTEIEPTRPVAFHLFSQAPKSVDAQGKPLPGGKTAEQHFAPLIEEGMKGLSVSTHFQTGSSSTLHHLIRSDILLGAQSSFSWLATLLHHGVTLAPLRGCAHPVEYDKESGQFDEDAFKVQYKLVANQGRLPRFQSMDDCEAIRAHDEEAKDDPPAGEGLKWRPKPKTG